ncbi:hypothetical protein C7212DRAFT_366510, partial [Tuber magnatum]
MRRAIPRITRPLATRPCCRTCCHPTTVATAPRHFATAIPKKADLPLQEVLRRKIWGTDEAPGAPGTPPPAPQIPVVEEPTKDEEGYIEESDGRALPIVGLMPGLTEWDVPTFANILEPPSTEAIHAAVHRAVVEVYTHVLNGKPVDAPATEGSVAEEGFTPRVRIEVRRNGEAIFHYGDTSIEEEILRMSTGVEGQVVEEGVVGGWLQEGLDGKGWVELGFRGDDIKFAVYKRVYRLTGIRVADPDITRTKTVADLLTHLVAKPPPTKLFDILTTKTELPTLPNVK